MATIAPPMPAPCVSFRLECSELDLDAAVLLPAAPAHAGDRAPFPKLMAALGTAGFFGTGFNLTDEVDLQRYEASIKKKASVQKEQYEFYKRVESQFNDMTRSMQAMKRDYYREIDHLREQLSRRERDPNFEADDSVTFFDPDGYRLPVWQDILEQLDDNRLKRDLLREQLGGDRIRRVPLNMLCENCRNKFQTPEEEAKGAIAEHPCEKSVQTGSCDSGSNSNASVHVAVQTDLNPIAASSSPVVMSSGEGCYDSPVGKKKTRKTKPQEPVVISPPQSPPSKSDTQNQLGDDAREDTTDVTSVRGQSSPTELSAPTRHERTRRPSQLSNVVQNSHESLDSRGTSRSGGGNSPSERDSTRAANNRFGGQRDDSVEHSSHPEIEALDDVLSIRNGGRHGTPHEPASARRLAPAGSLNPALEEGRSRAERDRDQTNDGGAVIGCPADETDSAHPALSDEELRDRAALMAASLQRIFAKDPKNRRRRAFNMWREKKMTKKERAARRLARQLQALQRHYQRLAFARLKALVANGPAFGASSTNGHAHTMRDVARGGQAAHSDSSLEHVPGGPAKNSTGGSTHRSANGSPTFTRARVHNHATDSSTWGKASTQQRSSPVTSAHRSDVGLRHTRPRSCGESRSPAVGTSSMSNIGGLVDRPGSRHKANPSAVSFGEPTSKSAGAINGLDRRSRGLGRSGDRDIRQSLSLPRLVDNERTTAQTSGSSLPTCHIVFPQSGGGS
eukprot:TRINITY_DN50571_c0_g1_i1.p1 TRINITY_DN50571_c0_g1~~TRINITY_DN50571_c0_g1_i1.p1  ORF type:complete len:735 (+),score=108.54 TRINITY_DN50571_c0_g1_i1:74-2278(+)